MSFQRTSLCVEVHALKWRQSTGQTLDRKTLEGMERA